MSYIVEKIKSLVENPSRDEGIQGLLKLQAEVPQNMKYKCRIACLHLMEMNHDWENIRKLVTEWKLVRTFAKELVVRMRKRVGEDPGIKIEDDQLIIKQLDRLNDKSWRQFSPKKTFLKYAHLTQTRINETSNSGQIKNIDQKKTSKTMVVEQKRESVPIHPVSNVSSIFSKISGLKNKQGANRTNSGNVVIIGGEIKKQTSKQKLPTKLESNIDNQATNKNYQNNIPAPDNKNSDAVSKRVIVQTEIPKKIVSLKYGGQKQKQKNKDQSKDEFSFSAVKAQQIQGFSNRKLPKNDDFDNSFLNFTHDQLPRDRHEKINSIKKLNILEPQMLENFQAQSSRHRRSRPLYSEQQLSLIQPDIPAKNRIQNIIQAQGIGALDMLRRGLKTL